MRIALVGIVAVAGLASLASANFVNPNFDTGDFQGWTRTLTVNGQSNTQVVEMVDIDGPGPLGLSNAAKFSVGRALSTPAVNGGIELTQVMSLNGGQQYTFSFDWAALRTVTTSNSQGGLFELIVDGTVIASGAAGSISGLTPKFGAVSGNFTPGASGFFTVGARITRPFTVPNVGGVENLFQYVDNFRPEVPAPSALALMGLGALVTGRRRR